jgi:endonuclease YncB( thermonuclease family)
MFLGEIMVRDGYAVEYHGQSKDDVQQQHLDNRKLLTEQGVVVL